jgi:hypothetical protein
MLAKEKGLTGKCVSERHYYASQSKLTAGEAARLLSRKTGSKMLAKDVKGLYLTHFGHEPEWHHSGFYQGAGGRTMGRTFFLSEEEVDVLAENYVAITKKMADDILRKENEERRKRETVVMGFYYTWESDYGGRYGRKQNYKVLHSYEGNELHMPDDFTPCDAETFEKVKAKEGKRYYGWDEPKIQEFQ